MKNRNKQTKFPVARIKRIMQKDEEVGKVAQATPVVICSSALTQYAAAKALELFLERLVKEAHKVTSERNARRVEPYHLKHAIQRTELLDFLKEIVENVPDPSNGAMDDDGEGPKKKRRAPRAKAAKSAKDVRMDEDKGSDDDD
ncbi:histone-fold-containing protein [Exidia glandulosa HHB12029]|uniref:Histone-fold-containing protein n=1 Tax=Exidia glandulosa HHB12029 TaxID=1314781 RepID=A0A165M929_EXIGL|nr:histone-fold-containing protein [Exidia glandulosa HHB12029]